LDATDLRNDTLKISGNAGKTASADTCRFILMATDNLLFDGGK